MQELEKQQINDWLSDWLVEAEAASAAREVPRTHTGRDSRESRHVFFFCTGASAAAVVRARAAALRAAGDGLGCTLVRIKLGLGVLYKDYKRLHFSHFSHFRAFFSNFQNKKHAIRKIRNTTVEVSAVRSWSGGTSAR